MVEPHSSNFRVITTNFLGVQIFRNFTVYLVFSRPEVTQFDFDDDGPEPKTVMTPRRTPGQFLKKAFILRNQK